MGVSNQVVLQAADGSYLARVAPVDFRYDHRGDGVEQFRRQAHRREGRSFA